MSEPIDQAAEAADREAAGEKHTGGSDQAAPSAAAEPCPECGAPTFDSIDPQPAPEPVLLRDKPEARNDLLSAIFRIDPKAAGVFTISDLARFTDALLAALRGGQGVEDDSEKPE